MCVCMCLLKLTAVCYVQCVRVCLLKLTAVCMYPLLFGTGSALHRCSVVWALYSAPTLVCWGMLYSVAHHCEQRGLCILPLHLSGGGCSTV